MMSTFSACADFAGSIAGAESAFQTAAADEPAGVCAEPHGAKTKYAAKTRTAARIWTIMRRAPATQRENTLSWLAQQVPRAIYRSRNINVRINAVLRRTSLKRRRSRL